MARKRINQRFLIILTVVVLGGLAVMAGGAWYMTRNKGAQALEQARLLEPKALEAAEAERKLIQNLTAALAKLDAATDPDERAAARDEVIRLSGLRKTTRDELHQLWKDTHDNYLRALAGDQRNMELLLKVAEARHELARFDQDFLMANVKTWEAALEVDPRNRVALNRLLDEYLAIVEIRPSADTYGRIRQRGAALAFVDPQDVRARACEQIGVLGAWMEGSPTPPEAVQQALAALEALLEEKADQWIIPWYVARANLRLASERQATEPDAAAALRQRALDAFEKAAQNQRLTPALALYASRTHYDVRRQQVLRNAADADQDTLRRLADRLKEATGPENGQESHFVEACIAHVEALALLNDPAAEQRIVELIQNRPDDVRVTAMAARMMMGQPGRQEQALELLNRATADDPALKGYRSQLRLQYEFSRLTELVQLRLKHYLHPGAADRLALRRLIEQDLDKAQAMIPGEEPLLLKLRAQFLLLDPTPHNRFDAIRLMQKALEMPRSRVAGDSELILMLARNYRAVGQSGDAVRLLRPLVNARPQMPYPRIVLADLLLGERRWDDARPHVEHLAAHFKDVSIDDPVQQAMKEQADILRIRLLINTGQRQQAIQVIQGLSEASDFHRLYKARLLVAAEEPGAAEALLAVVSKSELAAGQGDFPGSQELVRILLRSGRKEQAEALVSQALVKNPRSGTWRIMALAVEGKATPAELEEVRVALLEQIKDPVANVLQASRFALEEGKPEQAVNLLLDAEKRFPNDAAVLDAIFNTAVGTMNWALAEQYMQKLAQADVDRAGGAYYRTMLKLRRGDTQSALSDAQELTRKVGELAQNWVLLGMAQQAQRRFDEAIVSYNTALEKQWDNFDALRGQVHCHVELGQVPQARAFVERGLRTARSAFFTELGRSLDEAYGDPLKVTADRERAVRENPESPVARLALASNYQRVAAAQKEERDRKEYLAKAWTVLWEAANKWPDDPTVIERLDLMAFQVDKTDEGRKAIEQLIAHEKWKERPGPLLLLSRHYQRLAMRARDPQNPRQELAQRSLAEAERAFKQAVEKTKAGSNERLEVQMGLTRFYMQTRQVDQAVGVLQGLWEQSKDPQVRRELIGVFVNAGRHADAEKLLRKAVAEDRQDAHLLSLLAFVRLKQNELADATAILTQVLQLDPRNAAALYYRGMMRLQTGDAEAALADLVTARDLTPTDPDMRFALADVYLRRGQSKEAIDELEQAIQTSPQRRDLRVHLLQIYMREQRWLPLERMLADTRDNSELANDGVWPRIEAHMWMQRGDLSRAFEHAREAMRRDPNDAETQYLYLSVLLRAGQFEDVIRLTEGASKMPAPQVPWQIHLARAASLKANPERAAAAEGAFDAALSSIDARGDEPGAEQVVRGMVESMGHQWTVKRLAARIEPRWAVQLVQVQLGMRDREAACKTADKLVAELEKLPEAMKLLALRTAGMAYTASSTTVPGAGEKAVRAYVDYLEILERRRADVRMRLDALNNLACLLAEHPSNPNPTQALKYSQKAYDIMRQANLAMPDVLDTHGWVLVLNQREDEGIPLLMQVAAMPDAPPDTFYHLGEAYMKKKAFDLAEANLNRAMEIFKERQAKALVDPALEGRIQAAIRRLGQLRAAAATGATAP